MVENVFEVFNEMQWCLLKTLNENASSQFILKTNVHFSRTFDFRCLLNKCVIRSHLIQRPKLSHI